MHAAVVSSVNLCLYTAEESFVLRAVTVEKAAADAWDDTASLAFASNNDNYAAATSSEVFQLNPIAILETTTCSHMLIAVGACCPSCWSKTKSSDTSLPIVIRCG